ncbi:flagellar hook protein FlgE [Photobacterium ganghwense]|uniref:Flagellar hook protein FlgE n=1 Tax=Photobacterium ganghwense TaxID=320778 RepID=A0A0J1HHD7_9GAMM|nr:flagellar hook protein FlgE [Photobacterium ganghwense]KLV11023.1 flagellar hook protein FlgE [Photobacterium ganghwense]MBV1840469.1 flagellar hook protein FlgE [Photobacterium ganghwense]PSU11285.1 flagellar hook protein FlgE [Photobacterium ganghwense]QSV13403.1 flagellar hook protein FlgE [Photobacterium ganghwense]
MSMNIALSGLSAAQKDLNTTSNNIANANTYGFKESRAEFADVYSNSIFSNSKTTTGGGVQTSTVAQQFHEGSSIYTNNPLDLRVSGTGFFAVAANKNEPNVNSLTRNGAFHLNSDNEIVNAENNFLLGYEVNNDTKSVASYEPKPMKISDTFGQPQKSNNMNISLNLPNKETQPVNSPFDPQNPDSFNKSTSSTVYDSLGKPYKLSTYYVAESPTAANSWQVYYTVTDAAGTESPLNIDPTNLPANEVVNNGTGHVGHRMTFDTSGKMTSTDKFRTVSFQAAGVNVGGADGTQTLSMNYEDTTQYAAPFEIRRFQDKDGATTGYLSNVDIDPDGNILASYSNGKDLVVGRVAMARVPNEQGLAQQGGTMWKVSQESGEVIWGDAAQGSFGAIKNGTLEQSNIDMTQELVDLISAQRNFQASSRALDVNNQLQQNILQIR